jgi:hypothetical protein
MIMNRDHFNPAYLICVFLIAGLLFSRLTGHILPPIFITDTLEFTSSNIPIVIIDTHGATIVDDVRIGADMGIIDNGRRRNNINDPPNDYDGKIAIELRGSSSSSYPKKQYRFETQDESGNNLNTLLMGLPKENDWIFYGPFDDRSLIRNVLAFHISNSMGRYASRTRFCEIVLNDEYQGLYILMEKIKRDNDRVDIARLDEDDISADSLTGGYIIKIDKLEGENVAYWRSVLGITYQYHYPKEDEIRNEQAEYIKNYMNSFEIVMNNQGWNNPQTGYPAYIDVKSFVDHFIINEVAKNVDAYRISSYLYKDRDKNNGKLNAGPIWDYNLSFGKAWFPEDLFVTTGWQVNYNTWRPWDGLQVPFWWEKLVTDPAFEEMLISRWQDLRNSILSKNHIYTIIDSLVDYTTEARLRNFELWPEPEQGYEFEILELKSWIDARINWIDGNLHLLASLENNAPNSPAEFLLKQNYPNPFNPETTIEYELTVSSNVQLTIYSSDGKEIHTLVDNIQSPGNHKIKWDGKDNSGKEVSSGIYIYRIAIHSDKLTTREKSISKKMLYFK